jgi:hypothetical protein
MTDPYDLNFQNMGGLYQAAILHTKGIAYVPEIVYATHRIDGEVQLNAGYNWETPYFTDGATGFSEIEKPVNGDNTFENTVELFLPFSDHSELYLQTLRERKKYIVDLIDKDGNRRLVGTQKEPLSITHTFNTQKSATGRKGTIVVLKGISNNRAYFYSPASLELVYTSGSGS